MGMSHMLDIAHVRKLNRRDQVGIESPLHTEVGARRAPIATPDAGENGSESATLPSAIALSLPGRDPPCGPRRVGR
jgi:hypothetical protein